MKVLRHGLYGLLILLLVFVAGAAVFVVTFDANRYKSDIESLALKHTGRLLKINGEISVTLYPQLGAVITQASLSDPIATSGANNTNAIPAFISLQSTRLSVALLPLLKGEVLVDRIDIEGLNIRLVRTANGALNLQDLLDRLKPSDTKPDSEQSATPTPKKTGTGIKPMLIDIQSINIKNSGVVFLDEQSQQRWELSDIALATDRLAPTASGQTLASFRLQAPNQSADVLVGFSARYQLALQDQRLTLSEGKASAEGFWQDLEGVRLDLQFDAHEWVLSDRTFSGQALNINGQATNGAQHFVANVVLPNWQWRAHSVALEQLGLDLMLTEASLGPKPWHLALSGPVDFNLKPQTMTGTLLGELNKSPLKLLVNIENYKKPVISFDAHLESLDISSLYDTPTTVKKPVDSNKPSALTGAIPTNSTNTMPALNHAAQAGPFDFSALHGFRASGQLRIDTIQSRAFHSSDLQTLVNLQDGRLTVGPHQVNVWGGKIKGSLTIDANSQRVTMTKTVSNFDVAALLSSLSATPALSGRGNLSTNLSATGTNRATMLSSLTGQLALELKDGAIKGVDLQAILQGARNALGRTTSKSATTDGQTRFTALNATAVINNGVADNQDLSLKAPLFRVQGNGTIDLAAGQLNYLAKVAVADTADGQGGDELKALRGVTVPIRLIGPINRPSYRLDIRALAADLAKIKLSDDVTDKINKAVPGLGNALKGLFGR